MNRIPIPTAATFIVASLSLIASIASPALSQTAGQSPAEFYAGKTLILNVGFSPGGGYDIYARNLAPFLQRHIPGKPQVVVKNVPGAGTLKLAAYMQAVAPRNGTEIATVSRGAAFEEMLVGTKTNFNPTEINWLGSMNNEASVCVLMASTGGKTFEDLRTKTYSVGTQGKGSDSELFAYFLNNMLGTRMKIISGYPGTAESILAMERGEVDGNCGWSWSTAKQQHSDWIRDHKLNLIMQLNLTSHPELSGVPLVTEFARTPSERAQMELVLSRQVMGRPFLAPPAVPADRVAALRKAFMDALADPEFMKTADQAKLEINPVSGEAVQALIAKVFATPADVIAAARRNAGTQN